MNDVMLDIETLDTRPTAVILSIGAVRFNASEIADDPLSLPQFHVHVDLNSCLSLGRTVSGDTILWWLSQDDEARRRLTDAHRFPLDVALKGLADFIKPNDRVWGNGAGFDNAILADAYSAIGQPLPWRYWNDRCYRTLKNMVAVPKPELGIKHDALDDALNQALHLQQIYRTINQQ